MNEPDVFILANNTLKGVIDQVSDDRWDETLPEDFPTMDPSQRMTVREAVNYHAYDDAWVPDTLAGKTIDEVGSTYDGDLIGDDPKAGYARYVERANAAVRAIDDLDRPVHLTYGDFPTREYLKHITSFRGLRVFDFSKALGLDTTMPDDLVQGLWEEIVPEVEQWRALGVFGPKVEVPDDAPLQDRLLGITGRQP